MTEASRPGHSGIVTTDRKTEWRHDGEVGVAVGAVMVTTDIDAALAYSGSGAARVESLRCLTPK